MPRKWMLEYGLAAVLVAVVVIGLVLYTNPSFIPNTQVSASPSFLVLLTDPPTVPAGTTMLNLTYTGVSLHVNYPNGTADWLSTNASGTVDLFSLVNFSQTIVSTSILNGSSVDKVQFTIGSVEAEVNDTLCPVTALSDTFVTSVANSQVNQSLSGVLVDFNPTLVQIQATDSNGTLVYYYVLVPSATAAVVTSLRSEQIKVGTIVELGQNDREKLVRVAEEFSDNLTIVSGSVSVEGNVTNVSVTLMNQGSVSFRIFGLTLHGPFNATRNWSDEEGMGRMRGVFVERIGPDTIPFRVNGSSLVPMFGVEGEDLEKTPLTLQPGQNATLTFSGVMALQPDMGMFRGPPIVVTPITGDNYNLRLMGEGFEAFSVTATG